MRIFIVNKKKSSFMVGGPVPVCNELILRAPDLDIPNAYLPADAYRRGLRKNFFTVFRRGKIIDGEIDRDSDDPGAVAGNGESLVRDGVNDRAVRPVHRVHVLGPDRQGTPGISLPYLFDLDAKIGRPGVAAHDIARVLYRVFDRIFIGHYYTLFLLQFNP